MKLIEYSSIKRSIVSKEIASLRNNEAEVSWRQCRVLSVHDMLTVGDLDQLHMLVQLKTTFTASLCTLKSLIRHNSKGVHFMV